MVCCSLINKYNTVLLVDSNVLVHCTLRIEYRGNTAALPPTVIGFTEGFCFPSPFLVRDVGNSQKPRWITTRLWDVSNRLPLTSTSLEVLEAN